MADSPLVMVTGYTELDRKLRKLPGAMQRKFVRGALRKGTKRLVNEVKRVIRAEAYDEGSFYRSIKVKALKRSQKRIGVAAFTDTEKLYSDYEKRHGRQPHPSRSDNSPFFYPAVLEFGSETRPPVRALRRALYDNVSIYREYFKADLRQFIEENKVTSALPSVTGYTGRKAR